MGNIIKRGMDPEKETMLLLWQKLNIFLTKISNNKHIAYLGGEI
jgi:hypothetical protein